MDERSSCLVEKVVGRSVSRLLISRVALAERRRELKIEENPPGEREGDSRAADTLRCRLCGNIFATILFALACNWFRRGVRIYKSCQPCIIFCW